MHKMKIALYTIISILGFILLSASIYMNLIAKSSTGLTILLIAQIFIGIAGCLITLFMGLKVYNEKKNFELLCISFLEVLLVLGVVIFNYVNGYGSIVNRNDYIEYMEYVSMEYNIYVYIIFIVVIGILTLNLYLKEKLPLLKKTIINEETKKEDI